MKSRYRSKARSGHLRLQTLEPRDVPSGNVDAAIVGGVLTLTGDNRDNVVSIEITATNVIVTPDATTSVNGGVPGAPAPIPTVPTSLKATFGDGADQLSIKNNADFVLLKGAAVDLGAGIDLLDLTTTAKIQLGSLSVTAADGTDTVHVVAGAGTGSTVTGKTSFNFGNGSSTTTLAEIDFAGQKLSLKSAG